MSSDVGSTKGEADEITKESCLSCIRNWVPGVVCLSSGVCQNGFDCQKPETPLSAFYCRRALLARQIMYDVSVSFEGGSLSAYHEALRVARDRLAPMMADDLGHTAKANSHTGATLVALVNCILGE